MSDTTNTPKPELSDDQLEEAAGGCYHDPSEGGIIGGGCVIYPEPFPVPTPKPNPFPLPYPIGTVDR